MDINCPDFPCAGGLPAEVESIGQEYEVVLGGSAANFARVARSLGLPARLGGKVGDDSLADIIHRALRDAGVDSALRVDGACRTDLGMNFVAPDGEAVMALAGTCAQTLSARDVLEIIEECAGDVSLVYLGGCFKLPSLLPTLTNAAGSLRQRGITIVLDHGRVPETVPAAAIADMRALARAVDVYLPSRRELLTVWDAPDIDAAVSAIRARPEQIVAVKDGISGAVAYHGRDRAASVSYPVKIYHTVGAGDSFNAGFVAAALEHTELRGRLEYACAVAALMVSQAGVPSPADVAAFLRSARVGEEPSG